MTASATFSEPETGWKKLLVFGAGTFAVLAAIVMWLLATLLLFWLLFRFYLMITDVNGIAVQEEPPTVVDMLPPPPPPPPPPPEPQERPPEPAEQANAAPEPAPAPDQPAPAPMQIDGPAQAGADSYGMQSGTGGGMGAPASQGTCTGPNCGARPAVAGTDRFWGRNLANALESHIEASRTVNVDSFAAEYDVWISSTGALTQARMVRSSGNGRLDQTVLALLETARGLRPPPASIRMPQRIKVGRKRF